MSKWFSMAGRKALVTGASMSIGRSIALGFADHGAAVAVHYSAAADAAIGMGDAAQATLDKSALEAARASNGQQDVGLGLAYYGYQQYDKAVQALTQGIAKGGLKSAGEAQLLLGIAQLKAGNKDAAIKSFKSVKGDPTLERLATLWSLRARQGVA